jgi:predicted DNA-binding transcriptional regulator AlpA
MRKLASLPRTLEMAGGISDSTRRRIADFPKPIVLGRTKKGKVCRIAFVEEEVLAWCDARIRADRGETGARA